MNEESRLLATVWDALSGFISASDRQEAANDLVEAFVESGHEASDLMDAEGECAYLDRAIAAATDEDEESEEEDY